MKLFYSGKVILRSIYLASILALMTLLPLSCQLGSEFTAQLTGDQYYASAISLVQDKDLNIANNLPSEIAWRLTPTGNVSSPISVTAGLPWLPFQLYAGKILGVLDVEPYTCLLSNAQVAQIVGNIFYLLVFLSLLFWLLQNLGFNQDLRFILVLSLFGTPLFLHSLLDSTGNALPVLVLLMLQLCLVSEQTAGKKEIFKWILIGAIGGLVFIFEKLILYFTVAPILFLILRSPLNKKTFSWIGLVIFGWATVYLANLINIKYQTGHFYYPILAMFSSYFIEEPKAILRSLVGPNGIFFLFPIYAVSFVSIIKFVVDAIERGRRLTAQQAVMMSIAITGLATMFYNHRLYYLKDQLGSGHFLSQQIMLTIGLGLFLTYLTQLQKKFIKPALFISLIWALMWTSDYVRHQGNFGVIFQKLNYDFLESQWNFVRLQFQWAVARVNFARLSLEIFLLWLPFVFLGTGIYYWIKSKNYSAKVFLSFLMLVGFFAMTAVNESSSSFVLKKNPALRNKLVGDSRGLLVYDEYMATLDYLQNYFKANGMPEEIARLQTLRSEWAHKVSEKIIYDGIQFKENLDKAIIKPAVKGIFLKLTAENAKQCPQEE